MRKKIILVLALVALLVGFFLNPWAIVSQVALARQKETPGFFWLSYQFRPAFLEAYPEKYPQPDYDAPDCRYYMDIHAIGSLLIAECKEKHALLTVFQVVELRQIVTLYNWYVKGYRYPYAENVDEMFKALQNDLRRMRIDSEVARLTNYAWTTWGVAGKEYSYLCELFEYENEEMWITVTCQDNGEFVGRFHVKDLYPINP